MHKLMTRNLAGLTSASTVIQKYGEYEIFNFLTGYKAMFGDSENCLSRERFPVNPHGNYCCNEKVTIRDCL